MTHPRYRSIATPAGRLRYLDEGEGPTILFVHGTPGSSDDFFELIQALRPRFRCIAMDHLGFGRSTRPDDFDYSLASHRDNLRLLLAALRVERFALVVHDFGGPIALPLALDEPERVWALAVVSSWAWSAAEDPSFERIRPLLRSRLTRFLYLSANFSARFLVKWAWGTARPLTEERRKELVRAFPDRRSRLGTWAFARTLATGDEELDAVGARLGALRAIPALVVWGKADRFVGPLHLARWKRELPEARVVELERVGHFPHEEASAEVAEALGRLLEGALVEAESSSVRPRPDAAAPALGRSA